MIQGTLQYATRTQSNKSDKNFVNGATTTSEMKQYNTFAFGQSKMIVTQNKYKQDTIIKL